MWGHLAEPTAQSTDKGVHLPLWDGHAIQTPSPLATS